MDHNLCQHRRQQRNNPLFQSRELSPTTPDADPQSEFDNDVFFSILMGHKAPPFARSGSAAMVALEIATSFRHRSERSPLSEDAGDNIEMRRKAICSGGAIWVDVLDPRTRVFKLVGSGFGPVPFQNMQGS
jgi:hypothetical protein